MPQKGAAMGIVRQYTEQDVGRLLKESELPENRGHAESRHTTAPAGRGREATTAQDIHDRISLAVPRAGAFTEVGQQARVIANALNSDAGRIALENLNTTGVTRVVANVRVLNGGQMAESNANIATLPFGDRVVAAVTDAAGVNVAGIVMVLQISNSGDLHIRTSYPLSNLDGGSSVTVEYDTGAAQLRLPIG